MKRLNRNVGSRNAALEQRPEVLKAVGVYAAIHVLSRMVNDLVRVFGCQTFIRLQRIGIERRASGDVLAYFILQNLFATARNDSGANLAALALVDSHDGGFIFSASASDAALAFRDVHVPSLAADEGFVYFDFAAEFGAEEIILHDKPDAMEHKPCRLLSHFHVSRNLVAADSVFAVGNEPSCHEPFVERDWRIFHHSADLDGELALCMVLGASPSAALLAKFHSLAAASRADNFTVRPAPNRQIVNAVVRVGEVNNGLLEALWFVAHVV